MNIRPLSLVDCPAWSSLLADCFGRRPAEMTRLLAFFQPGEKLLAFGAWDGETLAAQYSCWLTAVTIPGRREPLPVGMSVNMAVHPAYRGRGLIKQVSRPVYDSLRAQGVIAGVGFSNAAGVRVDKHSKGYGYQVLGQLRSYLFFNRATAKPGVQLTTIWPQQPFACTGEAVSRKICFNHNPASLEHRYARHPFRQYYFGVWAAAGEVLGVVVYRPLRWGRVTAVSLLALYGVDLTRLVRLWLGALRGCGIRLIHLLATPGALVLEALKPVTNALPLPLTRNPYYLTCKPLLASTPAILSKFKAWSAVGGDIL